MQNINGIFIEFDSTSYKNYISIIIMMIILYTFKYIISLFHN